MKSIANLDHCFGCGVCSIVCPKEIITLDQNEDGFYTPTVNSNLCDECGLCVKVCSFVEQESNNKTSLRSYAAWSIDAKTRKFCTSGGICFELSKAYVDSGYKSIGVEYNPEKQIAQHYVAKTVEDIKKSRKSKYIPSYTLDAFSEINKKDKYIVFGTPCQITSLRKYAKLLKIEENFLFVDFFCRGVPSLRMFHKYLKLAKRKAGKVKDVFWRHKDSSWQDSTHVKVMGDKGVFQYSKRPYVDLYFSFFLGDRCMNKACYDDCYFKQLNSDADIRVCDLWGKKYVDNPYGVSGVVCFTKQGKAAMDKIKDKCVLEQENVETICEGQLKKNIVRTKSYQYVKDALKSNKSIKRIGLRADWIEGKLTAYILLKKMYAIVKYNLKKLR